MKIRAVDTALEYWERVSVTRIILGVLFIASGVITAINGRPILFKIFFSTGLILIGTLCLWAGLRLKPATWLVGMSVPYWIYFTVFAIVMVTAPLLYLISSCLRWKHEATFYILVVILTPMAYMGDEIVACIFRRLLGQEIVDDAEKLKTQRLSHIIRQMFYWLGLGGLLLSRILHFAGIEAVEGLWSAKSNVIVEALLFFLVVDTYMVNFHDEYVSPLLKRARQ